MGTSKGLTMETIKYKCKCGSIITELRKNNKLIAEYGIKYPKPTRKRVCYVCGKPKYDPITNKPNWEKEVKSNVRK